MMARRWRIATLFMVAMMVSVYGVRLIRFERISYSTPITFHNFLSANIAYMRNDWATLSFGMVVVLGAAWNWLSAWNSEKRSR